MSTDFRQILSIQADSVEAPKQLPPGKYAATVKKYETGVSTQKKTPYVEFTFAVESALDVAPEHEADASAALGKGNLEMSTTFYLTEKSLYRFVDFLEQDLGIERSGRQIGDMLTQATGLSCALIVDFETSDKTGKTYSTIKRTAKA